MGRRRQKGPEEGCIVDVTAEGLGMADTEGKKVFVHGALPGERVIFQRRRRQKQVDHAELLEVLEASPDRVEPRCTYFGTCGGCALQHIDPATQIELKQKSLLDGFERIGNVSPDAVLPPLTGEPWGYRRRARLGIKNVPGKGRVLVGFREKHAPYIADMRSCETLDPAIAELLVPLSELVGRLSIASRVPQVEVSRGDNAISLVLRVLDPPSAEDEQHLLEFALAQNVQLFLQSGGPDTIAPLAGTPEPEPLTYSLPDYDLTLAFGPTDFIQVNNDMNRLMVARALELAAPVAGGRALDLFCGLGNFSLALARAGMQVTGVEGDEGMVRKAADNASANGLGELTDFLAADLINVDERPAWLTAEPDLVLLDPPRAGAQSIVTMLSQQPVARIVYVSCHPGTLARDAGILVNEGGYRLSAAGVMDMFPQTGHVESVALFERAA